MITWLQLWPVLMMPTIIFTALASMPTRMFNGRLLGGGPVREYYLNNFVLPLLPADSGASLVHWFSTASTLQEWLMAFAVSINLNAIMLPILFVFGIFVIQISTWFSKKNIQLKRKAMR